MQRIQPNIQHRRKQRTILEIKMKTTQIGLRLNNKLIKKIEKRAKELDIKYTELIRIILAHEFR